MRTFTLITGLTALAAAQLLPVSQLASLSTPQLQSAPVGKGANTDTVSYNQKSAVSSAYSAVFGSAGSFSKVKRTLRARHDDGDCSPQPLGSGPTPSPDTAAAFLADTDFSNAANQAQTPSGYTLAFQNLDASSQIPMGYLGYDSVTSYNPAQCAAACNSKAGCLSFNIYFERDPTIDPGVNCTNPPSTTVIKCAYWGTVINSQTATNDGQYCEDFQIVIAGSNGYTQVPSAPSEPGYTGTSTGNATINAPTDCNSYITYKVFNDGLPYDPARCAAACQAETDYNVQYLNSRAICRFFTSYILLKNNVPQGQYCALYTRSWDISYATNSGQTSGSDVYTIADASFYSNTTNPGAQICNAACMSQTNCSGFSSSSSSSASSTTFTTSAASTTAVTTTTTTTTTTKAITTTTTTATTATTTTTTTTKPTTTTTTCTTTTTTTATTSTTTTTTTTTSTTKPVTTTTSCTTKATTLSTTTTPAPTPTPTGNCMTIKSGSNSWGSLNGQGQIQFGSWTPSIFYLDGSSCLRSSSNTYLYQTVSSFLNSILSLFGFGASTSSSAKITCSKGWGNSLTCQGVSASSLTYQSCSCPAGAQWNSW